MERDERRNLVGAFGGGMRFLGRGRSTVGRGRTRSRRGRLLIEINDGRREGAVFCQDGQRQRGEHEHERRDHRKLAQKVRRSSASKNGLAGAAECRTNFRAFSGLQQDRSNHEQADDDVNNDEQGIHRVYEVVVGLDPIATLMSVAKDRGSKQAPPTSAPSISSQERKSAMFWGVTLPPYRILNR